MTIDEAREILEKLIPQPQRGDGKSITHLMITEALNMAIKALEQEPKTEWIPVSERLPEEDGMYLVSIEGNITHKIIVDIAHWFECEKSNNGFYTANEVFAWMPLPKPYMAESEEDNG